MKNRFLFLIVVVLSLSTRTVFSQVASPYQVGTWQGFKSCAISYTFDDGCSGQFSKAIPIFDATGYKLTLFTVTSWSPNWTNLQNAASNGHEVACHTSTHPNLSTMTVVAQEAELKTSTDLINSNVTSQKCLTMATPYCAEGNDSLAKQFFIAVRGCQGFIEPKTPGNFMNVSSIICGNLGSVLKVKDFKAKADQAAASKGWLVYLIHGIDNDGGYSPLSSDTLKQSLDYLKENDSKFWVATFGNVARYIKERNCASVTETASSETSITVSITDTLSNNEWYNYPITIRRTLLDGWSQATVTQNGVALSDTIIEVNSVKYIQFNAVPDGGSVVISKVSTSGKNELKGSLNELNIRVNKNEIRFSIPQSCGKDPSVSIFDLKGAKLLSFDKIKSANGIGNVNIGSIQQAGIYLFMLTDQRANWTKQFQWF